MLELGRRLTQRVNTAWHASSGLALQVMERQNDIVDTIGVQAVNTAKRDCAKWKRWVEKDFPGGINNFTARIDDSGV